MPASLTASGGARYRFKRETALAHRTIRVGARRAFNAGGFHGIRRVACLPRRLLGGLELSRVHAAVELLRVDRRLVLTSQLETQFRLEAALVLRNGEHPHPLVRQYDLVADRLDVLLGRDVLNRLPVTGVVLSFLNQVQSRSIVAEAAILAGGIHKEKLVDGIQVRAHLAAFLLHIEMKVQGIFTTRQSRVDGPRQVARPVVLSAVCLLIFGL